MVMIYMNKNTINEVIDLLGVFKHVKVFLNKKIIIYMNKNTINAEVIGLQKALKHFKIFINKY